MKILGLCKFYRVFHGASCICFQKTVNLHNLRKELKTLMIRCLVNE